jgi:hypothetical protein
MKHISFICCALFSWSVGIQAQEKVMQHPDAFEVRGNPLVRHASDDGTMKMAGYTTNGIPAQTQQAKPILKPLTPKPPMGWSRHVSTT